MADRARVRFYRCLLFVIVSVSLAGCKAATPSPEPAPMDTPTLMQPTDTPPTATPTPISVEPSSAPKKIERANASVPLSDYGPWLVYLTEKGIVVVNDDGTGHRRLSPPPLPSTAALTFDLPNGLAPSGGRFAFRAEREEATGWDLQMVILPDGSLQTISPLLSEELENQSADDYDLDVENAVFWEEDALRWSPDGRFLAFVAALDGPSSDLYVFDSSEGRIRRLTTGDNQAATPIWTRDGEWIIHQEVETFGSGAGWTVRTVWAASVDGDIVRRLYDVPEYTGPEQLLGATESNELIVSRFSQNEPTLHIVDIASGESTVLHAGFPTADFVAFDPASGAVAYITDGIYLRKPGADEAEMLSDGNWFGVQWSPGFERFFAYGAAGVMVFSTEGEIQSIDAYGDMLAPSPDGAWLALSGEALLLYDKDWNLVREITEGASTQVIWRPDSQGLFYLQDDSLFYLAIPHGRQVLVESAVRVAYDYPSRAIRNLGWAFGIRSFGEGTWLLETEERGLLLLDLGTLQPLVTYEDMNTIGGDMIKVKGGLVYYFSGKDDEIVEILTDGTLRETGVNLAETILPTMTCLTPDGTRWIWYRTPEDWTRGEFELLETDLADGATRSLVTLSATDDMRDWVERAFVYPNLWLLSPDERFLYYGWHVEGAVNEFVSGKLLSLSRLDLETGKSVTIVPLTEEIYGKIDAALSADGRTLAYLRPKGELRWDLVVRDVTSGQERVYSFPAEMMGAGRLIFSPEGDELALTVAQIDHQILFNEVFVFDLASGRRRSIYLGFEDDEVQPMLETRAWTGDGWIVLGEGYRTTGAGTWIIRPDGRRLTRVTSLEFLAEMPSAE